MTYDETLSYLYQSAPLFQQIGKGAYKEGLDTTYTLDTYFAHPHRKFHTIHIAGTNGKGSCSHTLAAILQSAGYKTGLYTSPHLIDFRERIRVNGQPISQAFVVDFVERHRCFFEALHPSFFELTTAMAFHYFQQQAVDVAVIEVGLGGRLDCTNIITPDFSLITNISFDHTQFLGNTLAKIAYEKAGIIKAHIPVVIGESNDETRPVFEAKAKETGSQIVFAEDMTDITNARMEPQGGITYTTKSIGTLYGELGGIYQTKNAATVLCSLQILKKLGLEISEDDIKYGFCNVIKTTGLAGRWQKVNNSPVVICDTGHNVGGWEYLSRQLRMQKYKQMRIVFGMVDDKDVETVMNMLPKNAIYYFTKANNKRAISEQNIMQLGNRLHLVGTSHKDVKSAYRQALKDADKEDFIFVGGSTFIVADLLAAIQDGSVRMNGPLQNPVF